MPTSVYVLDELVNQVTVCGVELAAVKPGTDRICGGLKTREPGVNIGDRIASTNQSHPQSQPQSHQQSQYSHSTVTAQSQRVNRA